MARRTKQGSIATQYFWDIADTFLERENVSEGKLMGFPCLHVNNKFFSICDHRSGDLIVKLPKPHVVELMNESLAFVAQKND